MAADFEAAAAAPCFLIFPDHQKQPDECVSVSLSPPSPPPIFVGDKLVRFTRNTKHRVDEAVIKSINFGIYFDASDQTHFAASLGFFFFLLCSANPRRRILGFFL